GAQGALLAGAPNRHQRRRGRLRDRRQDHGEGSVRLRLRRPDRRLRQSGVERHYRSDQGGAHRTAGRGFRGWPAHHHRRDGRRGAEEAGASPAAARARHGRRNGRLAVALEIAVASEILPCLPIFRAIIRKRGHQSAPLFIFLKSKFVWLTGIPPSLASSPDRPNPSGLTLKESPARAGLSLLWERKLWGSS